MVAVMREMAREYAEQEEIKMSSSNTNEATTTPAAELAYAYCCLFARATRSLPGESLLLVRRLLGA
eukprot:965830-Prorocentrum_minimum.AAC.3